LKQQSIHPRELPCSLQTKVVRAKTIAAVRGHQITSIAFLSFEFNQQEKWIGETLNKIRFALQSLSLLVVLCAGYSMVQAQATRTWVSGVGDDANPCSRTAPCKTFQGTISKTAAKGEINVLDPGGFGAVTITKSITISSESFEAGILVSGTNGIIVNAGPTDVVVLRGLDFEGLTTALSAIKYIGGGQLIVERCTINGFASTTAAATNAGIEVDFTNQPAGTTAGLHVRNLRISNTPIGIRLNTLSSSFITALIDDLHTVNVATFGIQAQTNSFVTVTNARFDRTGGPTTPNSSALEAENNSNINAEGVTLTLNQNAVRTMNTATIRLTNSNIFSNTVGINTANGGSVVSFGNNRMAGNQTPGAPTSTVQQN